VKRRGLFLAFAALMLFLASGCMISNTFYYYTKGKVVKEESRLKIVDGYSLVLAVESIDASYEPQVVKHFFLEFRSSFPLLNIEYEIGGSEVRGYLLVRQGEKICFCKNLKGTVTIKRRTDEQILAFVDVSGVIAFDPEQEKGRYEFFGPTYIYRRAIDDVRESDLDKLGVLR